VCDSNPSEIITYDFATYKSPPSTKTGSPSDRLGKSNLEVHHQRFRSQSGCDSEASLITLLHARVHGVRCPVQRKGLISQQSLHSKIRMEIGDGDWRMIGFFLRPLSVP
jgi:hypothetical protein